MRIPSLVLPAGFAVAAFAAVVSITRPPGPGLDPDAMSYLGAAESFVSHGTLRIPSGEWNSPDGTSALGHFPPGFSLILALPMALGVRPLPAARGVEAVAAALGMGFAVWLVATVAGALGGALAGTMLLVTPALALDHLRVLSEPLYLLLFVASLALMRRRPDRPLAYGVVAALAGLVRYAGVAMGGVAALWALIGSGRPRQRLLRAVLAGGPTVIVQVAWALRTQAEAGTVRRLGEYGAVGATLQQGLATLEDWLAPNVTHAGLRALLALLVAAFAGRLLWRGAQRDRPFFALLGLAALCYAGMVLASRVFADAGVPFDERILSPLFLLAGLGASAAVGLRCQGVRPALRTAGGLVFAAWLGASAWRTVQVVRDARDGGWGYAGEDWQASAVVRWLRSDSMRHPVFSNSPPDVWFANGRNSWILPETLDAAEVADFGQVLRERRGVLVGFDREFEPMAHPAELARVLGLVVVARFDDATVWEPLPRQVP